MMMINKEDVVIPKSEEELDELLSAVGSTRHLTEQANSLIEMFHKSPRARTQILAAFLSGDNLETGLLLLTVGYLAGQGALVNAKKDRTSVDEGNDQSNHEQSQGHAH